MELPSRSCDREASRKGQPHLLAELRDREQAHQETFIRMSEEVEEFRKAFCSETQLRDEAYMDAMSQDDGNSLEIELRRSQSTVNQLTNQIEELQEMAHSLSDSQQLKDLDTASSSGFAHAPGKPLVFSEFFKPALPRQLQLC